MAQVHLKKKNPLFFLFRFIGKIYRQLSAVNTTNVSSGFHKFN